MSDIYPPIVGLKGRRQQSLYLAFHHSGIPREFPRSSRDSGFVYIAQNAARHPDCPIEPLFRSLFMEHPTFDLHAVDVITDRNNIRKLLQFVQPDQSSYTLESFTINAEITQNTTIFW
ncbi:geranylgeranyl pyrophosphate synthetase [Metarhizium guizhouense ARSEF 977]|uniref:Geranylgeranyl pyrophosphate synthetase n=1 Tax=Metarhizium guizhouense (strain ARSEF 977) TaxID=1276136 RepID=A0A0B4HQK1_METGA|nr:geranylgeranyl pyrophosphate synthetase [Metarhizium guizhouense ARSEF 977]